MSSLPTPFEFGERGLPPPTTGELMEFATIMAKSKLAPAGMDTPEKIFVCCVFGAENGLAPMQSMRCIVVINNLPSWRGDAALAMAMRSGKIHAIQQGFEGEGENRAAFFESKRDEWPAAKRTSFSVAAAKRAGLWGKAGPWTTYPDRMMKYRALGFHLRDFYADVLMGITIAEEADDMPRRVAANQARAVVEPTHDPLLAQLENLPANVAEEVTETTAETGA